MTEIDPPMTTRLRCPNPACAQSIDESQLRGVGRCPSCGSEFGPGSSLGPGSAVDGDRSSTDGPLSYPTRHDHQDRPDPPEIQVGTELAGRYQVAKLLGQGGMGTVWLAEDRRLKRKVALKVPSFNYARGNPDYLKRLDREAQIAARFHHPRICPIHDIGFSDGRWFIVLHYIEGQTLSACLKKRPFEPAEAVRMLRSVAETLQAAHDANIIHRDLKPSNLMIGRDGELIIMDFGLAKQTDAEEGDDGPRTIFGQGFGTAVYASPEQVEGRLDEIGPGTDIYSLGVILYEMLAQRRPFQGPNAARARGLLDAEVEPPSSYMPGISPLLDAIVIKAMAKAPGDRQPSMSRLVEELTAYLEGPAGPSSGPRVGLSAGRTTGPAPETHGSTDPTAVFVGDGPAGPVPGPWSDDPPTISGSFIAEAPPAEEMASRSTRMVLLHIRPGVFRMGSTLGEDDERPAREIQLTSGFFLGRYPVTQREYEAVTGHSPSHFKGEPGRPVEQIAWIDAIQFCNLLAAKDGIAPFYAIKDGQVIVPDWGATGYRLPTEAEWEYACRAGRTSAYGFGDDQAKLDTHAWHAGNSARQTHKVGGKRPNAWGLHDMHGNVWEWCWDWYDPQFYHQGTPENPRGPDLPRKFRTLRGGHWGDKPEDLRSANRIWFEPSIRVRFIGFRVARSVG